MKNDDEDAIMTFVCIHFKEYQLFISWKVRNFEENLELSEIEETMIRRENFEKQIFGADRIL